MYITCTTHTYLAKKANKPQSPADIIVNISRSRSGSSTTRICTVESEYWECGNKHPHSLQRERSAEAQGAFLDLSEAGVDAALPADTSEEKGAEAPCPTRYHAAEYLLS